MGFKGKLTYHFVFATKYRRKALIGLEQDVYKSVLKLANKSKFRVLELAVEEGAALGAGSQPDSDSRANGSMGQAEDYFRLVEGAPKGACQALLGWQEGSVMCYSDDMTAVTRG